MSLLRRRGIAARREGAPPPVPADPAPAYFQTDHDIGPALTLTDQPGYFQTDQNIQE